MKPDRKKLIFISAMSSIFLMLVFIGINLYIIKSTKQYIYNGLNQLPQKQAIMVLGAQVWGEELSYVLQDRVLAGLEIYQLGKAKKILLSGDHGSKNYDEVNPMRRAVLAKIPVEDIFMDHAGFDTYDSMVRAKEVFGVQSLIIVTQKFHINRAVYLARALGIDAVGVGVSEEKYLAELQLKWQIRESISRIKAFLDLQFHAKPKFLGEVIPITGDGRKTID